MSYHPQGHFFLGSGGGLIGVGFEFGCCFGSFLAV